MNFLNELEENTLIICNNFTKMNILKCLSQNKKLYSIKIMSIDEFFVHYFFAYNKETIYYLTKKYNISMQNAKMYLENMKYIINKDIDNKKINKLKLMYEDLSQNKLLIFDNYFKDILPNYKIIVLNNYNIDKFTKDLLDSYNVSYLYLENNYQPKIIYEFLTIEEECEFVFNQISSLLKQNININDIKITILGDEYSSLIKRFSCLYHIPVFNITKTSIISTFETQTFLKMIKKCSREEIFEYLKQCTLKDKLINLFNDYYFLDNIRDGYEQIKEDLQTIYDEEIKEGIEIVDFDNLSIYQDKYVFILGFNLENIPKIYKDVDFFNDKLKKQLGLFTSFEKNKNSHDMAMKIIKSLKNVTLSYKKQDAFKKYTESYLREELQLEIKTDVLENNTSNLYNRIKLTNYLDNMLRYNIKNLSIPSLYATYPNIPYLKYSNKFTGIELFNKNITLSYTSLNKFYCCAFRYYVDNILKLNIFEETFALHLGTIFHFVLSKIYNKDFIFEQEWLNAINEFSFSKKEKFYLKELKEELKKIIEVINYQNKLSGLNNAKLEENITINYNDKYKFVGVIDKIMFKEKEGNTYIALVDYKTGTLKINMENLQYGLDMQLPIYIYLVKNSNIFSNPKIIGFYLQKILFEKENYYLDKDEFSVLKDNLKLNGYSIDDTYLLSMFDESYENSEMIKGMKITSKGFGAYAKILSNELIDNLIKEVDDKIKNAFEEINQNNFFINPKIINGQNIGCNYCKYQDLCFKTGRDLVYLKNKKDFLDNKC